MLMPPAFIPWVVGLVLVGQASPGESQSSDAASQRDRQLAKFAADAARFEVVLEAAQPMRLELRKEPVLNWDGSAFVWTRSGRPEVIGALWTWTNPKTGLSEYGHAFHSLSEHPITAKVDGQVIWTPRKAGLDFRPIEGAPAVAADSRRRLVQLRELAAEFSAVFWKGGRAQLRMLTQPIIRYEPTEGSTRDGAIFAFTNTEFGTDPDALLILEAREVSGNLRWAFAFARFHYAELAGYHHEKEVWRVADTWNDRKLHVFGKEPGRDSTYYSVLRP
jgi:hypothetical protein